MIILVIGASSYVGARIYRDLVLRYGEENVIGTYNSHQISENFVKLDVTNASQTTTAIRTISPDIIVDVAAQANTKWCEAHPKETVEINEYGAKHVVDAANTIGAKLIYISSTAAMTPTTVYNKSKLAAEEYVKKCNSGYVILRPALVMGYSPSAEGDRPFNRLLKNLDEKTPAVYDISRKFNITWVGHISEIVVLSIEKSITGEIIPIAVQAKKTRFDVASDILSSFGILVVPKNDNDDAPEIELNLDKLKDLDLPSYTYEQIVAKIVDEIRHRERFTIE